MPCIGAIEKRYLVQCSSLPEDLLSGLAGFPLERCSSDDPVAPPALWAGSDPLAVYFTASSSSVASLAEALVFVGAILVIALPESRTDMSTVENVRRDELLRKLARLVVRSGLRTPAIWFLAAHEPLSFLGGQALLFFQPLLAPLAGDATVQDYVSLLEDRENVKRLLDLLEREP